MSTRSNVFIELQRAIYLFQERNRTVTDAYGTGLSLLEGRVLTDVSAQAGISATELLNSLQISATLLSRTIDKLIKMKLITANTINSDRRQKAIVLTSKGADKLAKFDELADANLNNFYDMLTATEIRSLERYFQILADGLGVVRLNYKRKEHPLRSNIRRISQALGMLENSKSPLMNVNNLEWHILLSLHKYSGSISAKTLVVNFSSALNTIASALKRLEQKKLVTKHTSKSDRRTQILKLTVLGVKAMKTAEQNGVQRLSSALGMLSTTQVSELTALICRMVGDSTPSIVSPEGYRLQFCVLKNEEQLSQAREFFCTQALRLGKANKIRANLFSQDSFCCVLMNSDEIYACLEIQPHSNKKAKHALLTHLSSKVSMHGLPIEGLFVEYAQKEYHKQVGAQKIVIDQDWRVSQENKSTA